LTYEIFQHMVICVFCFWHISVNFAAELKKQKL